MKHMRRALFILSLSATVQAFGSPGDAWFLTSQEFARLTPREQKEYVREVQRTISSLAERSEFFASALKPNRTIAAEAMQSTPAQVEFALDQASKWLRTDIKNSLHWTTFTRLEANMLPADDPKRTELIQKVNELEKGLLEKEATFKKSFAKDGALDDAFDKMKRAREGKVGFHDEVLPATFTVYGTGEQIRAKEPNPPKRKSDSFEPTRSAEAPLLSPPPLKGPMPLPPSIGLESPTFEPKEPIAPEDLPAPVETVAPKKPPAPKEQAAPKELPVPAAPKRPPTVTEVPTPPEKPRLPVLMGYRCMYAGFIVKNDPCRGLQSLPEDLKISGLNPDNFNCGDQALCNPLLFGVKKNCELKMGMKSDDVRKCLSQSHGICVSRWKYSTRDCAKAGGTDEALTSALELVKLNPDAWQEYLTSFYELCDDHMIAFNGFITKKNGQSREQSEQQVREDIEQTCSHAKKRLKAISDKYRSYDISARPEKKTVAPVETPQPGSEKTDGKK